MASTTRLDYDVRADTSYAELIANYWREIGVEVEIHTVDATQTTVLHRKDNTSDGMIGYSTAKTYSAAGLRVACQWGNVERVRRQRPGI